MVSTKILQPGEIESFSSAAFPVVLLPESNLFRVRAERLRQIATGHSLGDYLRFVATVADWQQEVFDQWGDPDLPEETRLYRSDAPAPPLALSGWTRDPRWRDRVRELAERLEASTPPEAQQVMWRLRTCADDWLDAQADSLLALDLAHVDTGASTMIAAALQVLSARSALGLDASRIQRAPMPQLCPVCGSHPVASLVRVGGAVDGLRYLVCSLCASQWYLERAKCSNCHNTRDIGYQTIENPESAIRAESCPDCRSYLKILYQSQTPELEPIADDLATLALDWLMSEEDYARSGVNLMLLQGEAGASKDAD